MADAAISWVDQCLKDMAGWSRAFDAESARGQAIILASVLDELLGSLLRAFMRQEAELDSLLKGPNAPFGSFSNRIEGSFALGLINRSDYRAMNCLRKIRNEFSHTVKADFATDKISSLVQNVHSELPIHGLNSKSSPRSTFQVLATVLIMRITTRLKQAKNTEFARLVDLDLDKLVEGKHSS